MKKIVKILITILLICLMCFAVACTDGATSEFTLTFDTDGGSDVAPIVIKDGSAITLPADPIKDGYGFAGWYYDSDKTNKVTEQNLKEKTFDKDLTFYAKWIADVFSVSFYDGDTLLKTETVEYGSSATAPPTEKVGYDFVSWDKEFDNITADTEVNAVYTIIEVKVTLYVDGFIYGEVLTNIEKGYTIAEPTEPPCDNTGDPNVKRYFHGWFIDSNYQVPFAEDKTFLADSAIYGKIINVYSNALKYEIINDEVIINEFISDTATVVEIPSLIENKPVKKIGAYAFSNKSLIKTLILNDGMEIIESNAFEGCSNLMNVTISDSVTSIGDYAFYGCINIESAIMPTLAISKIPQDNLKTVEITSGDIIGSGAFSDCSNLTRIIIPDSVTNIGSSAFDNCSSLMSVIIGNSVTNIGPNAFEDCSSLTGIVIPDSVTNIASHAFSGCSRLISIAIPDSVTTIGNYAFSRCSILASVTIGNSVTSIGNYAFSDCSSLTSVTIGNSVKNIGSNAFINCSELSAVHISDIAAWCNIAYDNWYANPLYDAKNLYLGSELVQDLVIPNSVKSIGNYAFYNCRSLTSVTIPNGVTNIGDDAFNGCSSLASIIIPDSVTHIGDWAFSDCSSLTSVTIPKSVAIIGDSIFAGCNELKTIYCEAQTQPVDWGEKWHDYCDADVIWGYGKNQIKIRTSNTRD